MEDEDDLRDMLAYVLEDDGYVVEAVATVADAAASAAASAHLFAALVSDFTLPDGTGVDVLRTFGASRPRVTLLLSGHAAADLASAGFDVVMQKPVDIQNLVAALRSRLE